MFLNLVILLICVSTIYSDESEEGKYIDLLPEDEKREFLENVARRILEEVESKDTIIKKSVELSDGQLNKHSAFVSKIMKEEKDELMTKHNNGINLKKKDVRSDGSVPKEQERDESIIDLTLRQGKTSIGEHEPEKRSVTDKIDANDKPFLEESTKETAITITEEPTRPTITNESESKIEAATVEYKNKDDNISIEITINTNKNNKKPESSYNNFESSNNINIPVQVVYDSTQNGQNEYVKNNMTETVTNIPTTTEYAKLDRDEYIYQSREENAHNDETRKTVTVMENYEPKKCWSSEESSKSSITTHKSTTKGNDVVTDESHRVVTNCDGKTMKFETTSQWIIVDPPDVTGGIYESIDITRSKKTNDTNQVMIDNGIIITTEAPIVNSDTADTTLQIMFENNNVSNSTQVEIPVNNTNALKKEEKSTTVSLISNFYKQNTTIKPINIGISFTVESEISNQKNTENKSLILDQLENQKDKQKIIITTAKNRFEENNLKASNLRLGDVETQLENSQKNFIELESKYNENKIKELKVYEILSGEPHFVNDKPIDVPKDLSKINNREIIPGEPRENGAQPNYVPIYNYSPNNAYFNAYNRLGPNYEDEEGNKNSDLINTNVLRIKADSSISFESRERNNKKYYFYNSGPSLKKIRSKILLPPSMPKLKKKKYHSQIYLDDNSDTEEYGLFRKKKKLNKFIRNSNKLVKKLKKQKEKNSEGDSLQVDEMYARGNIKNHIEAVRNYLSKKNYFQFYNHPSVTKKKKTKSQKMKNGQGSKTKKKDKDLNTLNIPKDDMNIIKDAAVEAAVAEAGVQYKKHENNDEKQSKKHKRLLRAKTEYRYGKFKPNSRPKTGTVDGFYNKPSKYGHGIDLDYYFGRAGPDLSNSNSREVSFSSSEESSLEKSQLTIGNLGSIYYSGSRDNYDDYRRNKDKKDEINNPGKGDKNKDDKPKTDNASGKESKYTMADFNLVKNISVASDLVPNVLMMQKLVGISERSGDTNNLNYYLTVLSDMIQMENRALLQYDWLGSAVDIQSALTKLLDLTEQLNNGDFDVHPADWELFKYVFYIYETVDLDIKKKSQGNRKMLHAEIPVERLEGKREMWDRELLSKHLPRPNNVNAGPKKLKVYGPYFSLRAQIKLYQKKLREKQKLLKNIQDFQDFLNSARDNLNDLHDAIKHIGMVSKQNTVQWFKNLKDVYLNKPSKPELLSVLLHLSLNRVVNLIEESAKEGVERSFVSYVRREKNASKIQRTKEEMTFALSVLRELKKFEN